MKRLLFVILAALALSGCMTANQLAGEKAYYEAMASLTKARETQPIFEMTPATPGQPIVLGNVGTFKVYAQPQGGTEQKLQQYVHRDYAAPWLNLIGTAANIAIPWWGAYKMVDAVAGIVPQTGHNNTTITTSTTGNNNKTQLAGDMNLTASGGTSGKEGSGGGVTITNPSLIYDASDSTHNPTIMEPQQPVIVMQPPPVIVEQPPPVIVGPSYPPVTTQ